MTAPNNFRKIWNKWEEPKTIEEKVKVVDGDHVRYIEFVLSNTCDLACVYCNEENSSTWAKELKLPILSPSQEWKNKVLENFYQYLEEKDYQLTPSITLAFSGGEPTYNMETFVVIEKVAEILTRRQCEEIKVEITSNLNTKPAMLNKFIDLINQYPNITWRFCCSVDDIDERNDIIRYHSKFENIKRNLNELFSRCPGIYITLQPSISVFNVIFLDQYIEYFAELLGRDDYLIRWSFGQNVIYGPEYLSPFILSDSYKDYVERAISASNRLWEVVANRNRKAKAARLLLTDYEEDYFDETEEEIDELRGRHVSWIQHLENVRDNIGKDDKLTNYKKWKRLVFFLEELNKRRKVKMEDYFFHIKENCDNAKQLNHYVCSHLGGIDYWQDKANG
jgi:organic radical activating enzyme